MIEEGSPIGTKPLLETKKATMKIAATVARVHSGETQPLEPLQTATQRMRTSCKECTKVQHQSDPLDEMETTDHGAAKIP